MGLVCEVVTMLDGHEMQQQKSSEKEMKG